jgi:uroporphyrinogen decarboxylase
MGFEAFCLSLYDDFALVKEVLNRLATVTLETLEEVLAFDVVGAVWMHDDLAYTSGPMIAPKWLRELFFPWVTQYVELCHARGRPFIYHSDGLLDKLVPDIVAAGVDALHPIEPKCMDIVAVKREYGGRLALIGNVDLGYTLTRGTPQEVREEIKYLIKNVAPGGGYLLGSANSITDYVPLENYKALLDAAFEYGRYPIAL